MQAGDAFGIEALRPTADAGEADVQALGHLALAEALVAQQHDARPQAVPLSSCRGSHPTLQLFALRDGHLEDFDRSRHDGNTSP